MVPKIIRVKGGTALRTLALLRRKAKDINPLWVEIKIDCFRQDYKLRGTRNLSLVLKLLLVRNFKTFLISFEK